jgi:hypothetical protein
VIGENLTADGVGEGGGSEVGLGVEWGGDEVGADVDPLAGPETGATVVGDEAVPADVVAPQAVIAAEVVTKTPATTSDRTSR